MKPIEGIAFLHTCTKEFYLLMQHDHRKTHRTGLKGREKEVGEGIVKSRGRNSLHKRQQGGIYLRKKKKSRLKPPIEK